MLWNLVNTKPSMKIVETSFKLSTKYQDASLNSFEYNNFWLVWKSYVPSYSKHPWDKLSKADILEALIWVFLGMFFGITIPKYLPVILKTIQGLSSTKVAFRGPPILIRKSYNHWQIYTWIARNAPDHQISYSLILGKCTLNPV